MNEKILEEFDEKFEIPKSCPDFLRKHLSELLMHIRAFLSEKLDQARAEERERMGGKIKYILDFAEDDKEMADDPEDPKVRINYFRDELNQILDKPLTDKE